MDQKLLDVGAVIKQAIVVARRSLGNRVEVELDFPKDTIHLFGDWDQMIQLISGMIQYRSRSSEVVRVKGNIKEGGKILLLAVSGTQASAKAGESSELDLPAMERIAGVHNGSLKIESEYGSVVELPLAVVPRDQEQTGAMQDNTGKCKVLVVDDNVDGAVTLSVILKHLGHSVRITHDGNSALAVGPEFIPDLVLMDIGMPGMDGYETCERMRAQDWSARARIVALTGWGQEEDKRKARRAGFDLHLVKPVDRKTLLEVIASTVEGRSLDGTLSERKRNF